MTLGKRPTAERVLTTAGRLSPGQKPGGRTGGLRFDPNAGAPRPRLLAARLNPLHIGVDRVHDLDVRMGLAIDDDLVDPLFGARNVDCMPLEVPVPPAAVP